jgi:WD40 repeat protein
LWNVAGRLVRTFDGDGPTEFVAVSSDGKRVCVGGSPPRVFEVSTNAPPTVLADAQTTALCGVFSSDGSRVFTGGPDGSLSVFDVASGIRLLVLKGVDSFPINRLEYAGSDLLAESAFAPTARIWSAGRKQDRLYCKVPPGTAATQVALDLSGGRVFAANEAGKVLAMGPGSPKVEEVMIARRVHAWEMSTGHAVAPTDPPPAFTPYEATSADGRYRAFTLGWEVLLIDTAIEAKNSNRWPQPGVVQRVEHHTARALRAEWDRNWFAAKFHAERALRDDPKNKDARRCLDAARTGLEMPDSSR